MWVHTVCNMTSSHEAILYAFLIVILSEVWSGACTDVASFKGLGTRLAQTLLVMKGNKVLTLGAGR